MENRASTGKWFMYNTHYLTPDHKATELVLEQNQPDRHKHLKMTKKLNADGKFSQYKVGTR